MFLRVLADMEGFQTTVVKEAEKAGDKAGATMGARMGATLKTTLSVGAKVAATAVAAGLAIASRGAAALENISADFQAQTGASAAEAEKAAKTINRVSGDERMSLQAVADVAVRVRRDLGATGPEADKLTAKFAQFARVTRQDAAGAVSAYDDILDSWGLTAANAGEIMDKLIVSQRRFGGDLTETQKTLAALAPSMRAANMEIDDGIALLGLFGAKGLDANTASAAFAKALTKVKSPAELQRLITDISNTKDPFARATKAADLFGARAGAKLANALGGAKLDEYKISIEDAAGATEKAADIIDNTFTGRIQKAISQATAGLREFGQGFGPALTGLASLSTLAGALGGGKLVSGILGPIGGLGKKLAVKLAGAIGIGFASSAVSGAAEAGGDVVGNMTAKQIARRLASTTASDMVAKSLSEGLIGVESSPAIATASKSIGTKIGGLIGNGIKIGVVLGVAAIANEVAPSINAIGVKIHETILGRDDPLAQIGKTWSKWVKDTPWPIGSKDAPDWARMGGEVEDGLDTALVKPLARTAPSVANWTAKIYGPFTTLPDKIAAVAGPAATSGAQIVGAIERSFGLGVGPISQATKFMLAGIPVRVREASFAAALAAAKTPGEIADAIQSRRNLVDVAMDNLTSVIKSNKGSERAKVLGYLIGSELAKALKSKDPVIRNTADETQKLLLSRLDELVPASGEIGKAGMDALNKAIRSKNPVVAEHARQIKQTILDKLKANTKPIGEDMAEGIAKGLSAKDQLAAKAARKLAHDAMLALKKGWGNPVLEANLKIAGLTTHGIGLSAEGGPRKKGDISWVGEEGPEIVQFGGDAFVTPADVSKRVVDSAATAHGPSVRRAAPGTAAVGAAPTPLAAKLVEVVTRSIANVAREVTSSVSDTTVVLRELVEKIGARQPAPPAAAAPQMTGVKWELRPQSFAQGGVVQGPPGQPVGIIAHAGEEVLTAKDRGKPDTVSAALVKTITRTVSDIAHRMSDTTVILRRITEKVITERAVAPAGPTIAARKPGYPAVAPPAGVEPAATGVGDRRSTGPTAAPVAAVTAPGPSVPRVALAPVPAAVVAALTVVLRKVVERVAAPPHRPIIPVAEALPDAERLRGGRAVSLDASRTGAPTARGVASASPLAPVAPRAVAQAVSSRVKHMREAMPGPWMPAAAIADVGGSIRPPTSHVPSVRAPSIAPARVPSGLAAVPAAGGGSIREGDIHVNLLDKLEVRSVRDIGGGLRMLGEQGYLGRKGSAPGPGMPARSRR